MTHGNEFLTQFRSSLLILTAVVRFDKPRCSRTWATKTHAISILFVLAESPLTLPSPGGRGDLAPLPLGEVERSEGEGYPRKFGEEPFIRGKRTGY
jgi:hypothetical protein